MDIAIAELDELARSVKQPRLFWRAWRLVIKRKREDEGGIEYERKELAVKQNLELHPRLSQPHSKRTALAFVCPTSHDHIKL